MGLTTFGNSSIFSGDQKAFSSPIEANDSIDMMAISFLYDYEWRK